MRTHTAIALAAAAIAIVASILPHVLSAPWLASSHLTAAIRMLQVAPFPSSKHCERLKADDFPFDSVSLGGEWNVPAEVVSAHAPAVARIMGCAHAYRGLQVVPMRKMNDAFIMGLYLSVKNVTEYHALEAFAVAIRMAVESNVICSAASELAFDPGTKCRPAPIVPHRNTGDSPYLSFFLTSADPIIALPARERMERYLNKGDIENTSPSSVTMRTALRDFIDAHPAWKNETSSYISLLRNPNLNRAIISRLQTSGNCFLIAPFVALHYAVNFNSTALDNRTVDITEYARKFLDTTSLAKLLLSNQGAHTDDITPLIFAPAPGEDLPVIDALAVNSPGSKGASDSYGDYLRIRSYLETHAVGILGYMATDSEFTGASATSFRGKRAAMKPLSEGHAMVLIGTRFNFRSSQYFLMLQNSWEKQQVVEVRQDYAFSRHATLSFVMTPQNDYRSTWPTVSFHSATSAINAGVQYGRPAKTL